MKAAAIVSCLTGLANAAAINTKGESPLVVEIAQVGNSEVRASITNTGNAALRVLRTGSILDSVPVEKVRVSQGAEAVPFTGVRLYVHTNNLQNEAFQTIGAKETVEVSWDAAQFHDLSAGGDFNISTVGSLRYAEEGSNKIAGQVVYGSNVLQAKVDGVQAAKVHSTYHAQMAKRVPIQNDCSSSQKTTVNAALGVARTYSQQARSAASAGTKLQEYFKSTSTTTKNTVVDVFNKIATTVVNSGTSGSAKLYCSDVGNFCGNGIVAYTQPAFSATQEYIVLCPYWFQFPARNNICHDADQPYVLIHEATHLIAVKGTDDVCYGYNGCVTSINNAQSLNNADSYALFANAIYANC
ncbi:hypothetical protein NUW58_g1558 [Xylaria curta]|uniref:Uncharacterized protein n=1 Tax=Xylaria curta TaxID=42375 RepID=A0ACC1PKL2_9PEZI|nr:hypothetical protein NUW58_g1558 [Xylaria curta]